MADFEKSLQDGAIGEHTIWNLLINRPSVRQVIDVRQDKRYQEEDVDFLVENTSRQFVKIETKTDYQADKTGNVAYELTTSGHRGCFEKTKADYVFYFVLNAHKVYLISMQMMRYFMKSCIDGYEVVKMGDNATGYLFPISELKAHGVIVDEIEGVI